jgi:hypothetical protein
VQQLALLLTQGIHRQLLAAASASAAAQQH